MHVAVMIPGIMGTRLLLQPAGDQAEEVWPPTPFEVITGYNRIEKLQRADLRTGAIIDKVACYGFYNYLNQHLAALNFVSGAADRRLVEFAYDWRVDNFTTAALLAAELDRLETDGATEYSLVCHSMGGLIGRLLLESGTYAAKPWFGKIKLFAALATPHLGAPLALARIFGLDASTGISGADFAKLAANRAYPSGYQLIPAPGEAAVWDQSSADLKPLDPYVVADAVALGLDTFLVERARQQHAVLAQNARPAHVRYFYFGGSGHRTATRVNVVREADGRINHARSVVTRTDAAGDGTVPLYSALPSIGQRQIVVNEHATVFKGDPFRRVFYRLLGGNAGQALEAAMDAMPGALVLAGSLDSAVYPVGERPELRLTVLTASGEGSAVEKIAGQLVVQRTDETGRAEGAAVNHEVTYAGPPIAGLTLVLGGAVLEPGLYALAFEGEPSMPVSLAFAVSAG